MNNKIGIDSKEILHPENKEQDETLHENRNNFITNIEKLKNYQFKNKIYNNRKFHSFHPLNSFTTGKDFKIKIEN